MKNLHPSASVQPLCSVLAKQEGGEGVTEVGRPCLCVTALNPETNANTYHYHSNPNLISQTLSFGFVHFVPLQCQETFINRCLLAEILDILFKAHRPATLGKMVTLTNCVFQVSRQFLIFDSLFLVSTPTPSQLNPSQPTSTAFIHSSLNPQQSQTPFSCSKVQPGNCFGFGAVST